MESVGAAASVESAAAVQTQEDCHVCLSSSRDPRSAVVAAAAGAVAAAGSNFAVRAVMAGSAAEGGTLGTRSGCASTSAHSQGVAAAASGVGDELVDVDGVGGLEGAEGRRRKSRRR